MWLPTFDHTFPFPIPMTQPSIKTATRDTGPIANNATQPVTVMLTEASDGKAICRFRAQSAQFDTGTTLFLKRAWPSASQLISAIHSESRSAKYSKKRSLLAATAYQISQHERAAQNQISLQLGDFTHSQVYGQAPQEKPDDCI